MSKTLDLTGMINDESLYLTYLPTENPVDLKAIIFAGIIIGAVGAVMDVAVSIASALWELKSQAPNLTFVEIFKSGINLTSNALNFRHMLICFRFIIGQCVSITPAYHLKVTLK